MTLIKEVNTKILSENELSEMWKIQKDMWAYWLWEYVRCNCCNKIHSKNDIFWHLSDEIKRESVTKLEEIFLWDSIRCKKCDSTNTDFIYDVSTNIEIFRDRYKEQAFLVLSYNESWDIVWFCDWYISSFNNIFEKDLKFHYNKFDPNIIENEIIKILCLASLQDMLYFSSLWTYERYINYSYVYDLLRAFFKSIDTDKNIPWITELDKNNSLYKIYKMMWSLSLWLDKKLVSNLSYNYDSDICVFPDPINDFKTKYDVSFRTLVKNHKIK